MPASRPNVLWSCADQMRFDAIGALGNPYVHYFQYSHAPRDNWKRGHDYADWLREQGEDPAAVLTVKNNLFGGLMEPTPEHDNVPPRRKLASRATRAARCSRF